MIVDSEDDAARALAEMLRGSEEPRAVTRLYATVTAVSYPTCSVRYDGETSSDADHSGVAMTVSCKGMSAGDRVIVDVVGHLATVTGVIAK